MNLYIKQLITATFLFICLFSFSQKKKNINKIPKCTTYINNLSNGETRVKDICYNVEFILHNDMNYFSPNSKMDKTKDIWKYLITIIDNITKSEQKFEQPMYVYEENNEIRQYHSFYENSELKALIFDKVHNSWSILLLQNEEYKILSSYSGYNFINAFDIKEKRASGINY